jgi:hypothetical protein
MQIIERNIADLIRAEYNPRELTQDQEKQLSDSLRRFGVVDPVIVNVHPDRKDIIIGGHQRSKVWQKLGNETIPTVELSLTYDQEKELNVRLNKNTGQFDMDMLKDHFETDDLIEWGFTDVELDWQEDVTHLEAEEDDFEVPDEVETDIVQGDLIEIGPHRLLCGDSTDIDSLQKVLKGEQVNLITDPPYGINANKQTLGTGKKKFHRGDDWDIEVPNFYYVLALVEKAIVWGGNYFADKLPINNDWLCWHKKNDNLSFSEFELAWSNIGKNCRILSHHWSGEEKLHPTMKPLKVIEWCIGFFDDKLPILDVFLGSGSTMVASHQLNRKCYGMELDPKYCQVIVDRMMKLDPSLSVKINGKDYGQE